MILSCFFDTFIWRINLVSLADLTQINRIRNSAIRQELFWPTLYCIDEPACTSKGCHCDNVLSVWAPAVNRTNVWWYDYEFTVHCWRHSTAHITSHYAFAVTHSLFDTKLLHSFLRASLGFSKLRTEQLLHLLHLRTGNSGHRLLVGHLSIIEWMNKCCSFSQT